MFTAFILAPGYPHFSLFDASHGYTPLIAP